MIQSLVSIAVLVGDDDAEKRVGCSGCLFDFILGKLASAPSGEHPVAIVRHVVSFFSLLQAWEVNLSKWTATKAMYQSFGRDGWTALLPARSDALESGPLTLRPALLERVDERPSE